MTTSSTLTAVSSRILVPEGDHAVATYNLSTPLEGAVQLKASIGGWDATVGVDTTGLELSTDAGASWVPVAANGLFTLDAGATGFALRTRVAPDSLSELPESFVLVAHQTDPNPYLHNSWWSQTQVQIQDASSPPVSAARATLTAQYAVMSADEGQSAEATFNLSAALTQATGVNVAVVGWGAVPGSDFSGFQYRLGTAGAWLDVPTGGRLTLEAGSTAFQLRTQFLADVTTPEAGESVVFVVSQAADSTQLTDAWWVQTQVRVNDAGSLPSTPPVADLWVMPGVDPVRGKELWVSDGTTAGTRLLQDIHPGLAGSNTSELTSLGNGQAVFSAYEPVNGSELWITDGTAAGTRLVVDAIPGTGGPAPAELTAVGNGQVVYRAYDAANGFELWVTDGTATGTGLLKNIHTGGGASGNPVGLTALGQGQVVFAAGSSAHGRELWTTDGTADGTRLLKDINPGASHAMVEQLAALGNGRAVFAATDGSHGQELWATDGTVEGSVLVKDIVEGEGGASPQAITALGNGQAVFRADTVAHGTELWVTDGTADGTQLLKDIFSGATGSGPEHITALGNGQAVFNAYDPDHGYELWVTDGTAAGTQPVRELVSGANAVYPTSFTALGQGRALFYVNNGGHYAAWVTDGTAAGTTAAPAVYPIWSEAAKLTPDAPAATSARLTEAAAAQTAVEGGYVVARFQLSDTLAADAQALAYLHGWSATRDVDTQGFDYSTNGTDWAAVPASWQVTIPAGASGLQLRTLAVADNVTESPESLVFIVQQASSNLVGSWWVTSTATVIDPVPRTVTGTAGADHFLGSSGQDVFAIPAGTSVALAGQFDTITSLGTGDVIDLPATVNRHNFSTVHAGAISDEAALLAELAQLLGTAFPGGTGAVVKVVMGMDAYLVADANGNGRVDAGGATDPDLFIHVVGGAALGVDALV